MYAGVAFLQRFLFDGACAKLLRSKEGGRGSTQAGGREGRGRRKEEECTGLTGLPILGHSHLPFYDSGLIYIIFRDFVVKKSFWLIITRIHN